MIFDSEKMQNLMVENLFMAFQKSIEMLSKKLNLLPILDVLLQLYN